jgi:hypothetical protein
VVSIYESSSDQTNHSFNNPYLKQDKDRQNITGSLDSVISNDASVSSSNQYTTSGKVRRSTVVTKTSKQSTNNEGMRKPKPKKEKILPSSSHHHKKLSSKHTPPSQSQSVRKGVAQSRPMFMPNNIRFIRGTKVTMLDEEKKIFIIDLLSPGVCNKIRRMAHNYVTQIHSSGSTKPTWRTLYTVSFACSLSLKVLGLALKSFVHIYFCFLSFFLRTVHENGSTL